MTAFILLFAVPALVLAVLDLLLGESARERREARERGREPIYFRYRP